MEPTESDKDLPYRRVLRAGDFVYLSGIVPPDALPGEHDANPIEEQARRVLDTMKTLLRGAGCELSDVIKCGCALAEASDMRAFNGVYLQYFPSNRPTRTTVFAGIPGGGRLEIDCVAYKPLPIR